MKHVAAVVLFAMLLIPGVALAGSSTDAALGLGAFAVFNQILSGTGIFGAFNPAPAVAAAPVVVERQVVVERPVYVQQPVVVAPPAPVYVAPVYVAPPAPVYYAPRPVVVYPAPGYVIHRPHGRFAHEWRHRH
jgi:hypothetical protein